jgi:RNA polymerase sigma factor for flagellar operon FliA
MLPEEIFHENLSLIDRVVDRVCRRARIFDADAEDFTSLVKLRLIDNDYAVIRRWESRASLATFLAIVIQRLLIDEWRGRGRWYPSADARRLGAAGVALEALLLRDRRTLAEAVPAVMAIDRTMTAADVERLAASLPERTPRARTVPIDDDAAEVLVSPMNADDRALAADAERVSSQTGRVVRDAFAAMPLEDRMLIRFRFLKSMSIADIARIMDVPQRPLYRRLEALLAQLRALLAGAGLDGNALAGVIGGPVDAIDFGWKTADAPPSTLNEGNDPAGEHSP